jgi:hypothetical protein
MGAVIWSLLAAGAFASAAPFVIHLLLKEKPKRYAFPAIRFVRPGEKRTQRTMKLRHLALLALRTLLVFAIAAAFALAAWQAPAGAASDWGVAAVAALATIVAAFVAVASLVTRRPLPLSLMFLLIALALGGATAWSAGVAATTPAGPPIASDDTPVVAFFAIDTSERMTYRSANRTAIDRAREAASEALARLPADSEILVAGGGDEGWIEPVDVSAARETIERMPTRFDARPLSDLVSEAFSQAEGRTDKPAEIYVFTDLARSAWTDADREKIAEASAETNVPVVIVDVGAKEPQNAGFREISLSQTRLAPSETLTVEATLHATGPQAERTVEITLEEQDPTLPVIENGELKTPPHKVVGRRPVTIPENGAATVEFSLSQLSPGLHHGSVRTVEADGWPADDEFFFTFEVEPAWPILVAGGEGVDVTPLVAAVAPAGYERTRYDAEVLPQADAIRKRLEDFRVVCLVDPDPLTQAEWKRLADFVEGGGGLAVFLGRHARGRNGPDPSFRLPEAQALLPAVPAREFRAPDGAVIAPTATSHPIAAPLRAAADRVPWGRYPIDRFWQVDPEPNAILVLALSVAEPLILERRVGEGRTVLWTSPISDPAQRPNQPAPWNSLATAEDPWPYFVLVNRTVDFLARAGEESRNYLTHEPVSLENPAPPYPTRYRLFYATPSGAPIAQPLFAENERLSLAGMDRPGHYRIRSVESPSTLRGFSVNPGPNEGDLARMEEEELTAWFAEDSLLVVHGADELPRRGTGMRRTFEAYPWLLGLVAFCFLLERTLAHWFYGALAPSSRKAPAATSSRAAFESA